MSCLPASNSVFVFGMIGQIELEALRLHPPADCFADQAARLHHLVGPSRFRCVKAISRISCSTASLSLNPPDWMCLRWIRMRSRTLAVFRRKMHHRGGVIGLAAAVDAVLPF